MIQWRCLGNLLICFANISRPICVSGYLDNNRQRQIGRGIFKGAMSIKLMSAVWENDDTKGSERLVLLALADMANDDGFCWPGFDHLARKCNLSRRFIIRIILTLEDKGLIKKDHRFDKKGDQTSNMYRVLVGVNSKSLPPSEPQFTTLVNSSSPKPSSNLQAMDTKKSNNDASQRVPQLSPSGDKLQYSHPAIQAFKKVTGYFPPKNLHSRVVETIGDNPDVPTLQNVFDTWTANGNNPRNIKGWLFDWYAENMAYVPSAQKFYARKE